jgi:hypothetical protein
VTDFRVPHGVILLALGCEGIANNQADRLPDPDACFLKAHAAGMVDDIVKIAGMSLNMALEAAANESQPANRVFSPQN